MQDGRCTSPMALPLYGESPSPGVCRICPHYRGLPRGLGDVVETVARWTGIKAVADRVSAGRSSRSRGRKRIRPTSGQCGGCAARRQALNDAVPFVKESGIQ